MSWKCKLFGHKFYVQSSKSHQVKTEERLLFNMTEFYYKCERCGAKS